MFVMPVAAGSRRFSFQPVFRKVAPKNTIRYVYKNATSCIKLRAALVLISRNSNIPSKKFRITSSGKFVKQESADIFLEDSDQKKKVLPETRTINTAKKKKFGIFRLESITALRRKLLRHAFLAETVSGPISYNFVFGRHSKFCLNTEKSRLAQIITRLQRRLAQDQCRLAQDQLSPTLIKLYGITTKFRIGRGVRRSDTI